jgi:phosphoribosyl 1,2-cyclic phosphate phosphodiesterase
MFPTDTPRMKVTILGTGTSQGVPVIGCDCDVCASGDPRDKRLRTAAHLQSGGLSVAIDAGPDFRQQMLRANVPDLNAVLLTHEHNDHIIGLDDVRAYNFRQWKKMPVYGSPRTLAEVRKRFAYVFDENPYPGAPMIELIPIVASHPFFIGKLHIEPILIQHGNMPVLGYRFGDFTYLTDVKTIAADEKKKVFGSKVLIINALHHEMHHSHLNLEEALSLIEELKPQQTYLTHMSHRMGFHEAVSKTLPSGVALAYDGLEILV